MATNNVINTVAAVQADQETGTSNTTFVTPGVQQFHASAAKAWVMANIDGTAAASYNVSSVGDTGTGIVTINFTVNFSSTSYGVSGLVENNLGGSAATTVTINKRSGQGVGSFIVDCVNNSTYGGTDPVAYHFSCFGDQ